jgi:tetratricopeptide (TPR) repeat protein
MDAHFAEPPASLSCVLQAHGLEAHRHAIESALPDAAALHKRLKAAGVIRIGRRVSLVATLLRIAAGVDDDSATPEGPMDEDVSLSHDSAPTSREEDLGSGDGSVGVMVDAPSSRARVAADDTLELDEGDDGGEDDISLFDASPSSPERDDCSLSETLEDWKAIEVDTDSGTDAEAAELEGPSEVVAGEAAAPPSTPALRDALKAEGNGHVARGDWRSAIGCYRRALSMTFGEEEEEEEADPVVLAALWSNLSLALLRAGEAAEAIAAADASISVRPDWTKGHYRRGVALLDADLPSQAAASLGRARVLCEDERERLAVDVALERAAAAGAFRRREPEPSTDDVADEAEPGGGGGGGGGGGIGARLRLRRPLSEARRTVKPLWAPRFAPTDPRLREHLLSEGFAVVRSAVSGTRLAALRAELWEYLELETPMRRGRPETWGGVFSGPAHLGLLTWGAIGQATLQWSARTEPAVGAAFETVWGLSGGDPLLTSFDGLALFRPPQLDATWLTRPALEWLHVDQGSSKRGMVGIQGQLLLYDQDAASGGLVVVPGSHQRHEELVPEHRRKDYVRFDADDARLDGLGPARLVCAAAGDLVLWDSRTVHASAASDYL